ncbi:MAG: helix-turn-helix domain-containing protein [Anaerolineae bacterium]
MTNRGTVLTLKEASKTLGVHVNTLRRWERRGLIRLVRLPGSRYRRVPREEVERIAAQMNSGVLVITGVRLEPPPTDPAIIAEGQALAYGIKAELAALEPTQTLEDAMRALRGRPWSL